MFTNHNSASLAKHFKNMYDCTQPLHGASIKSVEGQPYMLLNITKKITPEVLKEALSNKWVYNLLRNKNKGGLICKTPLALPLNESFLSNQTKRYCNLDYRSHADPMSCGLVTVYPGFTFPVHYWSVYSTHTHHTKNLNGDVSVWSPCSFVDTLLCCERTSSMWTSSQRKRFWPIWSVPFMSLTLFSTSFNIRKQLCPQQCGTTQKSTIISATTGVRTVPRCSGGLTECTRVSSTPV